MPDPVVISSPDQRNRFVEYLIEKRVRGLEYLKKHHVSEDQLWMGTVCVGKSDIFSYFDLDRSLILHEHDGEQRLAGGTGKVGSDRCLINFEGDTTMTSGVGGNSYTIFPQSAEGVKVSPGWLEENMPRWYMLGVSCANLMSLPLSGPEFANALHQLVLEMDHFYASGSATRMLAARALKSHRHHTKTASATDADAFVSPHSPSQALAPGMVSHSASAGSPAYVYLLVSMMPPFLPSYDAVVPSLCSTLIFAYKRLYDFDLLESAESVRRLVSIDRRLKQMFIGPVAKELGSIARQKTMLQSQVLREAIFPGFTLADDVLLSHHIVSGADMLKETFQETSVGQSPTALQCSDRSPRLQSEPQFRDETQRSDVSGAR